jgi:DNA topoisomerase-1
MYCKPRIGQKSKNAQEGHEALRVADPMLTPEILTKTLKNDLLVKVYKLIWQRTVAAAMPEAEISETTYTIQSNEHLFKLTSRELMAPGYRIVYGTPTPEEELIKVCFERDEVLENTRLQEQAKQTQPPSRYKEATLVKELQQQEIGRPSTYAMIVETLLSPTRGYCELIDKQLVPTDRGLQLASFLDRSFSDIINLDYTRQLEEYLDTIATKNLSKLDFLKDFYRKLENSISNNAETAGNALQLDSKTCPHCGELMVIRRSRYGKLFYGCSQYPACRGVIGIK